jgi:hypothetical protein
MQPIAPGPSPRSRTSPDIGCGSCDPSSPTLEMYGRPAPRTRSNMHVRVVLQVEEVLCVLGHLDGYPHPNHTTIQAWT